MHPGKREAYDNMSRLDLDTVHPGKGEAYDNMSRLEPDIVHPGKGEAYVTSCVVVVRCCFNEKLYFIFLLKIRDVPLDKILIYD